MIQLKWFRIETGADGAILSCTEVEAKGRIGAVVRYYEAINADKACKYAQEWWEKNKKKSAAITDERRSRLRRKGLCIDCCGEMDREGVRCISCNDARNKRELELRAGAERRCAPAAASPEEALDRSRAKGRKTIKLRGGSMAIGYRAALRKFDDLGPAMFRVWLVSEINRRSAATHQIPTEEAQAAE